LLSGLRYKIGGDTPGYMFHWDYYPDLLKFKWFHDIENTKASIHELERYKTGWFLYVMFLRSISKNFVILQLANALIFNYAVIKIVKRYSIYPFLTILMFYLTFSFLELEFEVAREELAISIFMLLAYDNFVRKKWLRYYIGVSIAYFVHPSAVVMFMLPLIRNIKLTTLQWTLYLIVPTIIVSIVGRALLGNIVFAVLNSGTSSSEYIHAALEMEHNSNYLLMYSFRPTVLLIIILLGRKKYAISEECTSVIFLFISLLYFSLIYFTASRLANYIVILTYIGITPLIYSYIKRFKSVWIVVVMAIVYAVPTLYGFKSDPEMLAKYYPYQNYILKEQTRLQRETNF
jgi:hypothetical protein